MTSSTRRSAACATTSARQHLGLHVLHPQAAIAPPAAASPHRVRRQPPSAQVERPQRRDIGARPGPGPCLVPFAEHRQRRRLDPVPASSSRLVLRRSRPARAPGRRSAAGGSDRMPASSRLALRCRRLSTGLASWPDAAPSDPSARHRGGRRGGRRPGRPGVERASTPVAPHPRSPGTQRRGRCRARRRGGLDRARHVPLGARSGREGRCGARDGNPEAPGSCRWSSPWLRPRRRPRPVAVAARSWWLPEYLPAAVADGVPPFAVQRPSPLRAGDWHGGRAARTGRHGGRRRSRVRSCGGRHRRIGLLGW